MSRKRCWRLAATLLISTCLAAPVFAQTEGKTVEVELLAGSGRSGDEVSASLMVSGPDDQRLGKVEVRVTFPGQMLTFVGVNPGSALAEGKASVKHQLVNAQEGVVIVTAEGAGGAPLPSSGELARLVFQIQKDVTQESLVLENKARIWGVQSPSAELQNVKSIGGTLVVIPLEGPALFVCFFYMH